MQTVSQIGQEWEQNFVRMRLLDLLNFYWSFLFHWPVWNEVKADVWFEMSSIPEAKSVQMYKLYKLMFSTYMVLPSIGYVYIFQQLLNLFIFSVTETEIPSPPTRLSYTSAF